MKYLTKETIKSICIVLMSLFFMIQLFKKQTFVITPKQHSVEYVDKRGNKYSQIVTEDVEKKQLKKLIDSLQLSLKNKGTVTQVVQTISTTDTFIKEVPVYIKDGTFHFNYNDSYLTLKGAHDSSKLNIYYQSKDTISFIKHTKNPLFKPRIHYVDVVNKNPYNKINIESSLQIKEKKSIIVLGPSVFYNPLQNNFGVGISLTYNLLSLKK